MKDEYDFANAERGKFFRHDAHMLLPPTYPGHPLTIAYLISKRFSSFEEASAPTCHGFPRAMGDAVIPGASPNVQAGLDVLRRLHNGAAFEDVVTHARDIWRRDTEAPEYKDRYTEGEQQAEQCVPLFDPLWWKPREGGAILDDTRTYRYLFWRPTGSGVGTCVFLCLNPSTADENDPDNTSKKCLKYARAWGYARMVIINLFAYRTRHPKVLKKVTDLELAIGRDNDAFIDAVCAPWSMSPWKADKIIAAWGGDGKHLGRDATVLARLRALKTPLHYLKLSTSKRGYPWHPLFLADATLPKEWS